MLAIFIHKAKDCLFKACWAVIGMVLPIAQLSADSTQSFKGTIAVIIHPSHQVEALKLTPENLNPIFWRKQRYWPKGLTIKPVNLDIQHPIRLQFSQIILGSLPSAQVDYWNGQYFNGIKPPYAVKSEEAVLRYVANTKGAIGYIDACLVDDRVNAVFWISHHGTHNKQPAHLSCK